MSTAIYTNSAGVSFNLLDIQNVKLKTAQLHKYEWKANGTAYKYGELLQTFTKDVQIFDAKFKVFGNARERMAKLNTFHDATEHDIMLMQSGKLIVDGYTIECYVIASDTAAPTDEALESTNDVQIYCPYPFWLKENKYEIQATGADQIIDGLDFPFDLPCDLGVSGYRRVIPFDASIPLDFRLVFYGVLTNPAIYINGHLYEVNVTVPHNSTLTISSIEKNDREKAVVLTYPSGTQTSVLYARNRESYIFEPIKPQNGQVIVSTAQSMNFDLYLIEKRSEPKWT
jgi:hypothetical protein